MPQLRYYIPKSPVAFHERLARLIRSREWPVWEFPRIIQIQTVSGCNARCIFCLSGRTKRRTPNGVMDWGLYRTIIDECSSYRMWRISPYLMNEPLLDRQISSRIRYAAGRVLFPTYTKINTNAALLSEEMSYRLLDSGLDILTCSVHGIVKESYEKTMRGLSLDVVLRNIDRFLEIREKARQKKPELRITMIATRLIERDLDLIRSYWRNRGVKVSIRPMTNRTDNRVSALGISTTPLEPYVWCVRPMRQAYVNVKGQILLCCNDWEQSVVLGDLNRQSLREVWNGKVFQEFRERFLGRKWSGLPCRSCLMPREVRLKSG